MTTEKDDLSQQPPFNEELPRRQLPTALRTTNLGMFIETRNGRYLLAFVAHIVAMITIVVLVLHIFHGAYTGVLIHDNSRFMSDVLTNLAVATTAFTIGALAEAQMVNAIKAALVGGFLYLIHTLRG